MLIKREVFTKMIQAYPHLRIDQDQLLMVKMKNYLIFGTFLILNLIQKNTLTQEKILPFVNDGKTSEANAMLGLWITLLM
jgi:hypothetical protein